MSWRFRRAATLILVLLVTEWGICSAQSELIYEYGGDLKRLCASEDSRALSACAAFVGAVLEIISNEPVKGTAACVPPLTKVQAAVAIAKKVARRTS